MIFIIFSLLPIWQHLTTFASLDGARSHVETFEFFFTTYAKIGLTEKHFVNDIFDKSLKFRLKNDGVCSNIWICNKLPLIKGSECIQHGQNGHGTVSTVELIRTCHTYKVSKYVLFTNLNFQPC